MYIVVNDTTHVVELAGENDATSNAANWCEDYPIAGRTVYSVASLPLGFIPYCWTYTAGEWAILSGKEDEVDAVAITTYSVPSISACNALGALLIDGITNARIQVVWNKVYTASYYEVKYRTSSGEAQTATVFDSGESTTSYVISGLNVDVDYYVSVRAMTQWGMTNWTTESMVRTCSSISSLSSWVTVSNNQVFKYASGATVPTNTSIVLTAALNGSYAENYAWEYHNGTDWAALSGTNNTNTYTLAHDNAAWTTDSLRIRCKYIINGDNDFVSDETTIVKVHDGSESYTAVLTNESHGLATNTAGVVTYTGCGTSVRVYKGSTELDSVLSDPVAGQFSVSASVTSGTVTIGAQTVTGNPAVFADHSALSTDVATITFTINIEGITSTSKVQTLTKVRQGADSTMYYIYTSAPVIFKDAQDASTAGAHANITVAGKRITGSATTAYGYLTITGNGAVESTTATATTMTTDIPNDSTYTSYTIKLYNQATVAGATLRDTKVVPVVYRGATGAAGANGTRTAILEMYKWAVAQPTSSFPSGTSTYTWATGEFTAPGTANGWSIIPPAPVDGQSLWVCRTLYSDQLTGATTSVTWNATVATSAAAAGLDGENGTRTAFLEVYKWASSTPTGFPSGTSTYTWSTGAFTAPSTANGWTVVPAALVAGQTLYACAMMYADKLTTTTSTVTWSTSTAYAVGSAGVDGSDGSNAITAVLSNESHSIPCSAAGVPSSYANSGTDIFVYEGGAALSYVTALTETGQFTVTSIPTDITCGAITAGTGKAIVAQHSNMTSNPVTIVFVITVRKSDGTDVVVNKMQSLSKAVTGASGSNAITAILSNEAHSIPCTSAGTPSSYTNSGTDIYVYEGTTAFSYVTSITNNNQFTVSAAVSGITCGAIAAGTGKAVVAQHSAMTTNPAKITYTITAKKSDASTVAFTKIQTLSKSIAGAVGDTGAAGPVIALTASKQAFTFTDNAVDSGQTDISFMVLRQNTAETVTWVSEPVNLVSGTGDSKTLSAATFGTNAQVVVTITTPSGLTDKITVVRLNKSTAAANATVGATWGLNISGQPAVYTQAQIEGFATTITNNTVTTAFVNALNVTANSVNSAWVYAGTLTAAQVNATGFTANNANIGNYIASTNFGGSTSDPYTTPGTEGWCISKSGGAAFHNVKVRGDIEATSIKTDVLNVVQTHHIADEAVSTIVSSNNVASISTSDSGNGTVIATATVTVQSGYKVILLGQGNITSSNSTGGYSRIIRGSTVLTSQILPTAMVVDSGTTPFNKTRGPFSIIWVDAPTAGTYTYNFCVDFESSTNNRVLIVMVVKK